MGNDRLTDEYDPQVVQARYLTERDKRLVPGRADIVDVRHDERWARYLADPFTPVTPRDPVVEDVDVVIVGGGIAGLVAGARLREAGVERIRIVDQAGGVGGTWYWNRYPGVMCDVEATIYLPMLEELGYVPRDRYASGAEILEHLQRIAERYDLTREALFHTGVLRAAWDEDAARWVVETDRGDRLRARWYVMAVGILNLLKLPDIPGMDAFAGHSFHSARWDYGITGGGPGEPMTELRGRTVALLGTGATGIQCLPPLGRDAEKVYVFQRTPSAIGVRGNRPTDPHFAEHLEPGWQETRWDNFQAVMLGRPVEEDLIDDGWTHDYAAVSNIPVRPGMTTADIVRAGEEIDYRIMQEHRHRVEGIVEDPATAEALKPFYRYRCKRPCFHDEYLAAFNLPNVELVDCPAGIERIGERGPVVDGVEYPVDLIVYATGFEAELTPLARRAGHGVVGRGGVALAEKWEPGAAGIFGMLTRGFPNLFIMPAPGQQAVVTVNYTQLAVLGAELVAGTVAMQRRRGITVFDVEEEAERSWGQKVLDSHVDGSAFLAGCTPSRINNEGRPELMNPRNGNYGRGFGDWFAYRDLVRDWLARGEGEWLELEVREEAP